MTTDASHTALRHAARRAWSAVRILPSTFRAAVTEIREERQQYRRAAYLIDSRHVRLRTCAARGSRTSEIRPCPDPRLVDPWTIDPSGLPGQTRVLTVCPGCGGNKKVACARCGGAGQLGCRTCGGGGRVMGQRGPKSCPSCRGKGTRRCDGCHGQGKVACSACDGLGRVQAWLEVEQGRRLEVKAHPRTGVALLHPELETGGDLDRDPGLLPVPLLSDTGWGRELPAGLGAELLPSFDAHADRIASRRLQVFESAVHRCGYRLVTGGAEVQVCARPLELLPESEWDPWRRRRYLAVGVGALVLLCTLGYHRAFTGRAEWFAQHAIVGSFLPMGALSAVLATLAAAGLCLPRRAWGWLRVRLPALAIAGIWAWMGLSWLRVQPSSEGARASIQRDELDAARRELRALEVVGVDDPIAFAEVVDSLEARAAELEQQRRRSLDDEHLARVERAGTTSLAIAQLEQPWEHEDSHEAARDLVLARARAELQAMLERHDGRGLGELADAIAPHDEDLAARARSRRKLCEAHACRANGEWRCVVAALAEIDPREGDAEVEQALVLARDQAREGLRERLAEEPSHGDASLEQQRDAQTARLADARAYLELTGEEPPVDIHEIEGRLATLDRKLEQRRKKEEAQRLREERQAARAARKTEEREARAARKAKEREARAAQQADRVQCCDGTTSPSCRYSQGSLRGCCSWHGGVC